MKTLTLTGKHGTKLEISNEWVKARTIEVGDCYEWTGTMGSGSRDRQPIISFWDLKASANFSAARSAWELRNGRPPHVGMIIYRSCLNHKCVNQKHLVEGTHGDLVRVRRDAGLLVLSADALARKSAAARARSRWSDDDVARVLAALDSGGTLRATSAELGVPLWFVTGISINRNRSRKPVVSSVFSWRP